MTAEWWSVYVETAALEDPREPDEATLGELLEALADHAGIVTGGYGHPYGARIAVEVETVAEAVSRSVEIVTAAAAAVGLPAWPIVCAEAHRSDVLDTIGAEAQPDRAA